MTVVSETGKSIEDLGRHHESKREGRRGGKSKNCPNGLYYKSSWRLNYGCVFAPQYTWTKLSTGREEEKKNEKGGGETTRDTEQLHYWMA